MYGTIYSVVKTTVYLDPDLALSIRQLAEIQGRSQAELIREALQAYARQAPPPKPKGMGMYRSGRSDVSGRYRELLRQAVRERRWR